MGAQCQRACSYVHSVRIPGSKEMMTCHPECETFAMLAEIESKEQAARLSLKRPANPRAADVVATCACPEVVGGSDLLSKCGGSHFTKYGLLLVLSPAGV